MDQWYPLISMIHVARKSCKIPGLCLPVKVVRKSSILDSSPSSFRRCGDRQRGPKTGWHQSERNLQHRIMAHQAWSQPNVCPTIKIAQPPKLKTIVKVEGYMCPVAPCLRVPWQRIVISSALLPQSKVNVSQNARGWKLLSVCLCMCLCHCVCVGLCNAFLCLPNICKWKAMKCLSAATSLCLGLSPERIQASLSKQSVVKKSITFSMLNGSAEEIWRVLCICSVPRNFIQGAT